jgi:hypothetical protein
VVCEECDVLELLRRSYRRASDGAWSESGRTVPSPAARGAEGNCQRDEVREDVATHDRGRPTRRCGRGERQIGQSLSTKAPRRAGDRISSGSQCASSSLPVNDGTAQVDRRGLAGPLQLSQTPRCQGEQLRGAAAAQVTGDRSHIPLRGTTCLAHPQKPDWPAVSDGRYRERASARARSAGACRASCVRHCAPRRGIAGVSWLLGRATDGR